MLTIAAHKEIEKKIKIKIVTKKFQRKTQKEEEMRSWTKKQHIKRVWKGKDACFLKQTNGWFLFACLGYYANKVYT